MKRQMARRRYLASVGAVTAAGAAPVGATRRWPNGSSGGDSERFSLDERLGANHVDSEYHHTDYNYLNEGANVLEDLGSRVIKVWYHLVDEQYPHNSDWPSFDGLVDQARHEYFRELFDRPFQTYHLSAYAFDSAPHHHYYRDGVTDAQLEREVEEFEAFARYLLEEYRGTGKEFVLSHWEGDWAILGTFDDEEVPRDEAIEGMIRWLNARQKGIERAREAIDSDVVVLGAAEVNLVVRAMNEDEPRVVNAVLPDTEVDVVSYSAYDLQAAGVVGETPAWTTDDTLTPPEHAEYVREVLDYINDHAPEPSSYVRQVLVDPAKNVFLGEYGLPEEAGTGPQKRIGRRMTEVALDWGARWALYWQVYDNEGAGFWLIDAEGEKTPFCRWFEGALRGNEPVDRPSYVELTLSFDEIVEDRSVRLDELALLDETGESISTFDVGESSVEPHIHDGAWEPEGEGDRTWRWFGTQDMRSRVYVRKEVFEGAHALRLYGEPVNSGVTVEVYLDGEPVDEITFNESGWSKYEVALVAEGNEGSMDEKSSSGDGGPAGASDARADDGLPGFTAPAALAGAGGASYVLLNRRHWRSRRREGDG